MLPSLVEEDFCPLYMKRRRGGRNVSKCLLVLLISDKRGVEKKEEKIVAA